MINAFNCCLGGDWNNTQGFVSWRIINDILYFQHSKEIEDWRRNINIIPSRIVINNVVYWIPKGLKKSWLEIETMISSTLVIGYVGFSLGASLASLASLKTGVPAIVFGCPNFLLIKKDVPKVLYIHNKEDIVSKIPLLYKKGNNVKTLNGKVKRPKGVSFIEWFSGHSPKMYRQRLEE